MIRQFLFMLFLIVWINPVGAHHVLGRPAYSLNEDSNTPPAMAIETQIGDYFVSAMVYPAFPKPQEAGRIHFYATHLDTGIPLNGTIKFKVRNDRWFGDEQEESLGAQVLDDGVYRQGFVFQENGNYVINVSFDEGGEPYSIDVPLRVGIPSALGPLGMAAVFIFLMLAGISLFQRKRLTRAKVVASRDERHKQEAAE